MKFNVEHYTKAEMQAIHPWYVTRHKIEDDEEFVFEKGAKQHCAVVKTVWINAYLARWEAKGYRYRKGQRVFTAILHELILGCEKWRGLKKVSGVNFKEVYKRLVETNSFNLIEQSKASKVDSILEAKFGVKIISDDKPTVFKRLVSKRGTHIGWELPGHQIKIYRNIKSPDLWIMDCKTLGIKGIALCSISDTKIIRDNEMQSRAIAKIVKLRLTSLQNSLTDLILTVDEFI